MGIRVFVKRNVIIKPTVIFRRLMSSSIKVPITVNQGTVLGTQSKLPNGNAYFSFKGIPYAVPPIGNLRFKPPVPLEKFHQETIDCSKEGGVSFQKDPITGEIIGGEDCLFLNVYTPKLNSRKPLPVMVWVHGGAFVAGSGNSDFHLPLYLMQEDVVIVTLNYRLGIFGFLHLPEGDIHGNAGLRDQLLALKWINKNITKFNGDPLNITLFGQSAGAVSVHLHTMFPESKKYFHKAIIQSGNAVMEWAIQKDPLYKARKLAELMGSKAKIDKEIGESLRNEKDSRKFFVSVLNVLTTDERRRDLPMAFKPVIENGSSDVMISKSPLETLLQQNTIDIPLMMGYTSMEGITTLPTALKKIEELDKDLSRFIPRSINIEPDDPKCQNIAEEIRQFYFKGQKLSKKFMNELVDLLSDYHFIIDSNVAAEIHSRRQHKSQLYFYRFSFDGELNLFKILVNLQKLKGACHGDELFYLFQMSARGEPLKPGTREEKMVKQMSRMWANFAKYGNPTPPDDQSLDFKWEPVKKIGDKDEFILDYLEIDEYSHMERNPGKERIDFWRKIFKTWNDGFIRPKL